jgi:hypothetical protein
MRIAILILGLPVLFAQAAKDRYDVVVYGGTSGGVAAAVQAARMGRSVILIEPGKHLGGLSSGGLGMTDSGNRAAIGGISREFYQRLKAHYEQDAAWRQEKRSDYKFLKPGEDGLWRFEPHVAEKVFADLVREAKVPVVLRERLDLKKGVTREGTRVVSIAMESGRTFRGRVFIDATYEGDLMARAGVTYTVGREANSVHGETLNGVQARRAVSHQFLKPVDPYVKPGDPASGLLPGVHGGPPGEEGQGDKRVQAYCFRMCLTDAPENRLPFPKPEGYDPMRYELYLRTIQAGWRDVWGNHQLMPNRKTDTNNHGGFSTDNIGMNYDYPDGDYAAREKIIREHETYQKGMMWFLVNDPRVPEDLRAKVEKWGLAKDEFTDNGNWPHQIYVREARRMVSDYVHTEQDCRRQRQTPEPVGMGSYNMDSHHVQRYVDADGKARNEGDIQMNPGGPYLISCRSLRPKAEECTNLLVPVCISCSHIAYGSVRMEPVFMILGQSAATAAAFAVEADLDVQKVDYAKLRDRLLQDKQVLELGGKTRSEAPGGTVVDDAQAKLVGTWAESSSVGPFVGTGYRHDENRQKGEKSARFETALPKAGRYEVRLSWTPNSNRATNIPVTVHHAEGTAAVRVNQQKAPEDGAFTPLGTFRFAADKPAAVVVETAGTDGHVVIDAVQFLPKD